MKEETMPNLNEIYARIDDLVESNDYQVREKAVGFLKNEIGKILLELSAAQEEHIRLIDGTRIR